MAGAWRPPVMSDIITGSRRSITRRCRGPTPFPSGGKRDPLLRRVGGAPPAPSAPAAKAAATAAKAATSAARLGPQLRRRLLRPRAIRGPEGALVSPREEPAPARSGTADGRRSGAALIGAARQEAMPCRVKCMDEDVEQVYGRKSGVKKRNSIKGGRRE